MLNNISVCIILSFAKQLRVSSVNFTIELFYVFIAIVISSSYVIICLGRWFLLYMDFPT